MEFLIYLGAFIALLGLAGLGWCIWLAVSAKRANLPDAEMKARLQKVVALNMAAMGLSAMGLMMIVIGIAL
ncbi:MAG: hypothetical protein QNL16_12615 [Rhodobacterales bacterium]|jgi:hypothetical protein|nr:hypothetical protein [Pseudomonadota bacterium]MDA1287465.1 hypothetical protein [Pseudomonadota bacterium]HBN32473.1 hypothetical protein [Paracoccaceae bacterium]